MMSFGRRNKRDALLRACFERSPRTGDPTDLLVVDCCIRNSASFAETFAFVAPDLNT